MERADFEDSAIGLLLCLPCRLRHGPVHRQPPTAENQVLAATQRYARYQANDSVETARPVEAPGKRMAELEEENRELRELAEAQANQMEEKAAFALPRDIENVVRSRAFVVSSSNHKRGCHPSTGSG